MNLVPYPVSLKRGRGEFALGRSAVRLDEGGGDSVSVRHKLSELELPPALADVGAFTAVIGAPDLKGLHAPARAEGYALRCDRGGVAVRGRDADGLFWGLTTLQQLLTGARRTPCVEIRDYPAFALRYHHDDISRKQVSTVADFKRIVRLLSSYKIRYYTPYMEDMLFLASYPDIGEGRGRLMPREVKAVLAEAQRYNVTVFPTYSLIGHQENLLRNPKYRRFAREVFQAPSSYDPTNPILRPYLRKVIHDVCALFPDAPYFHACFDETQGLSEEELVAHANWCAGEIGRHGKKMLMWVDMFKNHYGLDKIHRLAANVIPVEWNYGDPRANEAAYRKADLHPSGLAGYNNWGKFLPDFDVGKQNIDAWAGSMKRLGGPGFGASMWGDDGYENSRDLCWNLFAYNGEAAWRGGRGPVDFEARFQATFYGRPLPALSQAVHRVSQQRRISPGLSWRLFRVAMSGLVRRVTHEPKLIEHARHDLRLLTHALRDVRRCRGRALREAGHFDHFEAALRREMDVASRLLLAGRVAHGLKGAPLRAAVRSELANLTAVKRQYRDTWLRHNKRPNIEVSLAVYDEVAASLRALVAPPPAAREKFIEIDLNGACNAFVADVGGTPLGRAEIHGIPFRFAPTDKTHVWIKPGEVQAFRFAPAALRDLHLIYGGQTLRNMDHADVIAVALYSGAKRVFAERLKNILDICCWWAPLGEHIWAGGGYRYVNRQRNQWALKPGPYYGLMRLSGFRLPRGLSADRLEITSVGKEEFALFAATLERM